MVLLLAFLFVVVQSTQRLSSLHETVSYVSQHVIVVNVLTLQGEINFLSCYELLIHRVILTIFTTSFFPHEVFITIFLSVLLS